MKFILGLLAVGLTVVTSAESVSHRVNFPDGEYVEVNMKFTKPYKRLQLPESVKNTMKKLDQEGANGDPDTVYAVGVALLNCQKFGYQSDEELGKALLSLESVGKLTGAFDGREYDFSNQVVDRDSFFHLSKMVRKSSERCRGLNDQQVAQSREYMKRATVMGSYLGVKALANSAPYGRERLDAWMTAWRLGDPTAPSWIGRAYLDGWAGKIDVVKGFAYEYLGHELIRLTMTDEDGNLDPHYYEVSPVSALEADRKRLTEKEYEQAIQMSKTLLKSNKNCCLGRSTADR